MSKTIDTIAEVEVTEANGAVEEVMDPDTVYAHLVRKDDGYHIIDFDGTEGPVCKETPDSEGTIWVVFTPNKSNRKYINKKKADKFFDENPGAQMDLYYKATKHLGATSARIPNESLIKYLSEEHQAEYKAIIARAQAAKQADKAKPMTELEKAKARLEKAKAALAKLEAEAAGETIAD